MIFNLAFLDCDDEIKKNYVCSSTQREKNKLYNSTANSISLETKNNIHFINPQSI